MKKPPREMFVRAETALRVIDKWKWRRRGEEILGLDRGQLRAHLDRPMSEEDKKQIEDSIASALREHVAAKRAELKKAEDAAAQFRGDSEYRRNGYMSADLERDRVMDFLESIQKSDLTEYAKC